MHSLSVSGEVNGAQGVCGLLAAKLFQCQLGKQTVPTSKVTAKPLGWAQALAGIRARLVSAIRGCFLLGLVLSASWKKSSAAVCCWPCTADTWQIFRVVRSPCLGVK